MKIEIPKFVEKAHPDNFIDWLSTIEIFLSVRYSRALEETTCERQEIQYRDMGQDEEFLPANHRQESFLEYHNLSLRIPYVEDFIAKIDWLQMRCVVDEDEEPVIT
uniref:Uncharacterized protein n=1 Tax=Lactuca sativa TaxID=4236 RepID=A0A9R1UEK6_LACSA|nr:hypothetical protein LSAT_V11C900466940 [Lactuca sativa]